VPVVLVAAQAAIGLGVFFPRYRRIALGAGIVAAVMFWIVFESLGGIADGDATDPGAAPLLIILALSLWSRVIEPVAAASPHPAGVTWGSLSV
jgi:lipopolysaccharide export LptBFGC system permease protein LptF